MPRNGVRPVPAVTGRRVSSSVGELGRGGGVLGEPLRGGAHGGKAGGVFEQPHEGIPEPRGLDLFVLKEKGRAGVGEETRVGGLVVGRGEGVRDEDGGHPESRYLGDRGGAGAREHEVGRGQDIAHVVDVGAQVPARRLPGR